MAKMSMSILAGSTVMMLTLTWGSVIAFGSYDLSDTSSSSNPHNANTSMSSNAKNNKPFSLTGYGVRIDNQTRGSARIMLMSMVPFLVLQLAQILSSATAKRVVVLISLIISVALLVSCFIYQKNLLQKLLSPNGRPDELEIKKLFQKIDENNDSSISSYELRAFMLAIQIDEFGLQEEDFVTKIMDEFDTSGDSEIDETEFVIGVSNWLNKANTAKQNNEEKQSLLPTKKGCEK
ncbi:hypothetical protein REPUB_Repub14bG0117900 [Reevesia pubescens]